MDINTQIILLAVIGGLPALIFSIKGIIETNRIVRNRKRIEKGQVGAPGHYENKL